MEERNLLLGSQPGALFDELHVYLLLVAEFPDLKPAQVLTEIVREMKEKSITLAEAVSSIILRYNDPDDLYVLTDENKKELTEIQEKYFPEPTN